MFSLCAVSIRNVNGCHGSRVRWSVADDKPNAVSTIVHLEMAVLAGESLPSGEGLPLGGLTSASRLVVECIGSEKVKVDDAARGPSPKQGGLGLGV